VAQRLFILSPDMITRLLPLPAEVLAFTGALEITRAEAADLAAKAGCTVGQGVTKHTTILIVGNQDASRLAGHEKA
jgi:DNA polymerase-3 subunit epsilon